MFVMAPSLSVLYTRISPAGIAFLKFILEGYDGLAVLSTEDNKSGIVSIRYFPACRNELVNLLLSLQHHATMYG